VLARPFMNSSVLYKYACFFFRFWSVFGVVGFDLGFAVVWIGCGTSRLLGSWRGVSTMAVGNSWRGCVY
jgi:hypothetical protein